MLVTDTEDTSLFPWMHFIFIKKIYFTGIYFLIFDSSVQAFFDMN